MRQPRTSTILLAAGACLFASSCREEEGDAFLTRVVAVSPSSTSVLAGDTVTFRAIGIMDNGATPDVTDRVSWASTNPDVATVLKGVATGKRAGVATISASLHERETLVGTAQITVEQLLALHAAPSNATVPLGRSLQCKASADTAAGTIDVTSRATWTISPPIVASVSSDGLVRTSSRGKATITATMGGQKALIPLEVVDPVATSLEVTPFGALVKPADTIEFHARIRYSDGTFSPAPTPDWQSSNLSVALITSDGAATAATPGQTTITARHLLLTGTTVLVVADSTLKFITVLPNPVTLSVGQTAKLTAVATLTSGQELVFPALTDWSSSNPVVAVVSPGGVVTANGSGEAIITASLFARVASTQVKVTP